MQGTRADVVTEWVIYAIRTFATLPFDLQIEPFVSSADAKSERLIVKVDEGEQYLEADQGFNDTLTLTLKTVVRSAEQVKDLWAKIDAAFTAGLQNAESNARALTLFSRLDMLTENATSSMDNSPNFRHFSRTIPLHVKLL